ncbi:MAG: DDE-type integrase/transposase/recombinase [Roseobacter sp.]
MRSSSRTLWLWRGVDQDGLVPDEILQRKRDKRAAKRLLRHLMKQHGRVPKPFLADKLRSFGAAMPEFAPSVEHRYYKRLNSRSGNSLLPFEKRERAMQGYWLWGNLQRFISIYSASRNCFSVPARRRSVLTIRQHRLETFDVWNVVACAA